MGYNYEQAKVLVAEDCSVTRSLIRGLLQLLSFRQILCVEDADQAWQSFQSFKPDLIITDLNMPPTDGIALLKNVRTNKKSHNKVCPIIVLTAYSEKDRVSAAAEAGMTAYIVKPITSEALFKKIKMVVDDNRDFVETEDYFGPNRRSLPQNKHM